MSYFILYVLRYVIVRGRSMRASTELVDPTSLVQMDRPVLPCRVASFINHQFFILFIDSFLVYDDIIRILDNDNIPFSNQKQ